VEIEIASYKKVMIFLSIFAFSHYLNGNDN